MACRDQIDEASRTGQSRVFAWDTDKESCPCIMGSIHRARGGALRRQETDTSPHLITNPHTGVLRGIEIPLLDAIQSPITVRHSLSQPPSYFLLLGGSAIVAHSPYGLLGQTCILPKKWGENATI